MQVCMPPYDSVHCIRLLCEVCHRWVAYDDATQRMELLSREDTLPVWVEGEHCCVKQSSLQCLVRLWSQGKHAGRAAAGFCAKPTEVAGSNELRLPQRAAGRSTIVTMAAVQRASGVNVAAVGLTNMMNAGGAVKDFQLSGDSSRNGDSSDASASVQVGRPLATHSAECVCCCATEVAGVLTK